MSKRHQYKASGKKTRIGQHRKVRHKENNRLASLVPSCAPPDEVSKKKPKRHGRGRGGRGSGTHSKWRDA